MRFDCIYELYLVYYLMCSNWFFFLWIVSKHVCYPSSILELIVNYSWYMSGDCFCKYTLISTISLMLYFFTSGKLAFFLNIQKIHRSENHRWFKQVGLFVCLFDLILWVPSTIFKLNRDGSSWVETVLS